MKLKCQESRKFVFGVLAVQGDVSEHVLAMEQVLMVAAAVTPRLPLSSRGAVHGAKNAMGSSAKLQHDESRSAGSVVLVHTKEDVAAIDALIIPGGESTTISRVMQKSGVYEALVKRVQVRSLPIMGTCAGCIMLAKKIVEPEAVHTLEAMDIEVERNAFGRQKESFEAPLIFANFDSPINAVFIRGPLITRNWGTSQVLATYNGQIVAVRQDEFLALSFHPELTADLRIHQYFVEMVCHFNLKNAT